MFSVNDDMSIYVTRGDTAFFRVTADSDGGKYIFQPGEVVRFKVVEKKACENVMFYKDFPVTEETEVVEIFLTEDDTKIGDVTSKPTDYWYEIELNPFTNPQTVVGYDEDGAKVLKLFPEGDDVESAPVKPEDIPVVDKELDMTSKRPVENQAVAREFVSIRASLKGIERKTISSEEKLVASDGTVFRFGVNDKGEYGYILTKDGADSVIPFKRAKGNAKSEHVLNPYTFTNDDGVEYTGTMTNNGAKTKSLNCGGSYTIPKGYHNGSGKVTANSLASQTSGTATAAKILKGYTAWVGGVKLTGTSTADTDYATYKNAVVNGLKNSGLGVTSSTSASSLEAILLSRFPQTLVVYNRGEFPSTITTFTTKSELYPTGQLSFAPGWGVSLDFKADYMQVYWSAGQNGSIVSDAMIDVTNFSKIKIEAPTVTIGNDDPEEGFGGNLKGVLYKATKGEDTLAKVFNLNEEFDLNGITGKYYVGVFGYGAYTHITNITLTA